MISRIDQSERFHCLSHFRFNQIFLKIHVHVVSSPFLLHGRYLICAIGLKVNENQCL